jgi:predicted acetyltransferase
MLVNGKNFNGIPLKMSDVVFHSGIPTFRDTGRRKNLLATTHHAHIKGLVGNIVNLLHPA